jgi:hypothetical protein
MPKIMDAEPALIPARADLRDPPLELTREPAALPLLTPIPDQLADCRNPGGLATRQTITKGRESNACSECRVKRGVCHRHGAHRHCAVRVLLTASIIAAVRKVHGTGQVIVVNLFLGWTAIGWVVALVMAFRAVPPATRAAGPSPVL